MISIEQIQQQHTQIAALNAELHKNIIGQQTLLDNLIIGLLCKGHILLEGMPGLAKTLAIKTLAQCIGGSFSRVQFTPDLLPADITGTMIYNQQQNNFEPRKGPIFANFILADEINRAPAKVQSALLEAMQEQQVTLGNNTYQLPQPFLVLATQNPIEQQGTYTLPEAQADRFMLKVKVDYPNKQEELAVVQQHLHMQKAEPLQVLSMHDIQAITQTVQQINIDERILAYIVDIVQCSRRPADFKQAKLSSHIAYGASPRASIALAQASRAHAFLQQRNYVLPEDVRACCYNVLRHRIGLSYEAQASNLTEEDIITEILNAIIVP